MNKFILLLLFVWVTLYGFGQQTQITGQVIDPEGEPMIGVTIIKAGTTNGTVTDFNGNFSITAAIGSLLEFNFIGFQKQLIEIDNDKPIKVKMKSDVEMIDDVVIVGYGTQKEREITGVVETIKVEKISEVQAPESMESMLQGRVAGVNIQMTSGEPGAQPTVIIRGLASVSSDGSDAVSEPLYVVDGVPIISTTNSDFAVTSTNVLADLDPSDIADMTVLKDASAAAIYGSRAANGVILITTKKGKLGRPQINVNVRTGINFVPELRDVVGGVLEREQVERLYELYAPEGTFMPQAYTDITNPYYNNSSNWQDYVYNTSYTQNYNASIRGAGDFGQYSVSAGYMNSEGIVYNTGFKRYNTQTNTTFNALDNRLSINSTIALSRTDQSKSTDDLSSSYSSLLPLPSDPLVEGADSYDEGYDININDRIRLSTDMSVSLYKSLNYNVRLSYEYARAMRDKYSESRETLAANNSSNLGETRNFLFQNTLSYTPQIGKINKLSFLAGQSMERTQLQSTYASSTSSTPTTSGTVNWPESYATGSSGYSASSILSYFGRVNYSLKERYLLGASFRTDGSSKFGANNRWGKFPSASLGWIFSEEKGLKELSWIDMGKLRASWGVSGTTWDKDYLALGAMDGGTLDRYNSFLEISYGGINGYTPDWNEGFKNEDLTWVTSTMTNIGMDLSLLKNKVDITIDFYEKLTEGLLLTTALPTTSGYNSVYRNAADVLNRGFEFSANGSIFQKGKFKWNMDFNFAYNQNYVVGLPDGNADIINVGTSGTDFGSVVRVGSPLNGMFFYQSEGIYQTENEIPINPETGAPLVGLQGKELEVGDRKFKDLNGDYEIDVNDRVLSGDPNPNWIGGVVNDFSYKNWSLSTICSFIIGRDVVNSDLINRLSYGKEFAGSSMPNFENYDIWEKSGDNAKFPTLNPWSDVNQIISQDSEYIEDGSYFKVKSITLSYNLTKAQARKLFMQKARLYCTIDNVQTFQSYSGPDAELMNIYGFDDSDGYPNKQMILFGISFGL